MTAPGDIVLIVILLSVFLACAGYAAGRLHQRHQTEEDREEAYRDGYETATQNVFSSAARMLTSRRSGRTSASASVTPPAAGAAPPLKKPGGRTLDPTATPPTPTPTPTPTSQPAVSPSPAAPSGAGSPSAPLGAVAPASVPSPGLGDEALGFPAPLPPPAYTVAEPTAIGGVTYRPFPNPRVSDGSGPLLGEGVTARPPLPRPRFGDRSGPAFETGGRPAPAGESGPELEARPEAEVQLGTSGHPGVEVASGAGVGPEAAVPQGLEVVPGVRLRPETGGRQNLRPRAAGIAGRPPVGSGRPGPEQNDDGMAVGARPAGHRADENDPADPLAEVRPEVSSGRHTVPDELVQASTYRLPPDRVFRAKVPDGSRLPDEPTTRLAVPKPRES